MRQMLVFELGNDEYMLYSMFDEESICILDWLSDNASRIHFKGSDFHEILWKADKDEFYGIRVRIELVKDDEADEDSDCHEEYFFSFEDDPLNEIIRKNVYRHREVTTVQDWMRCWFGSEYWYRSWVERTFRDGEWTEWM